METSVQDLICGSMIELTKADCELNCVYSRSYEKKLELFRENFSWKMREIIFFIFLPVIEFSCIIYKHSFEQLSSFYRLDERTLM